MTDHHHDDRGLDEFEEGLDLFTEHMARVPIERVPDAGHVVELLAATIGHDRDTVTKIVLGYDPILLMCLMTGLAYRLGKCLFGDDPTLYRALAAGELPIDAEDNVTLDDVERLRDWANRA